MKAIKLYLKEGTTLRLLFEDGITKEYDVLTLANEFPSLNKLKNRQLFKKGKLLKRYGVVWNEELDLDEDTVYYDGKTVPNDENAFYYLLGNRIREVRVAKGITQKELSLRVNIDQGDLSKIETGHLFPTLPTLRKIVKGLDSQIEVIIK